MFTATAQIKKRTSLEMAIITITVLAPNVNEMENRNDATNNEQSSSTSVVSIQIEDIFFPIYILLC